MSTPRRSLAHVTSVEIRGEDFWIDGAPTYAGRMWQGRRIEGLLLNARMVQATFDDLNPATRTRWAYPDTREWDPERNIREFCAALPTYRAHGLLAVTVSQLPGWQSGGLLARTAMGNSVFSPDGALRPPFADRMRRAIKAIDASGIVAIVGFFVPRQRADRTPLTTDSVPVLAVSGQFDPFTPPEWADRATAGFATRYLSSARRRLRARPSPLLCVASPRPAFHALE